MERADEDPATDAIVWVGLGVLGAARRLDEWLAAVCAAPRREPLPPDDPALLAALGLVALRRTALRWIGEAAEPPHERGAAATAGPREILR